MDDTRLREFEAIKSDIVERLEERQGEQAYMCDLGFQLTESENNTGAWLIGIYQSREYMADNALFIADVLSSLDDSLAPVCDPFNEPEKYLCIVMINAYEHVWSAALSTSPYWNEHVEIGSAFIEDVKGELETLVYETVF
ncbi:MAG: hypothetical protein IKZ87_02220 [Actinomycetaceae bacterium]|nr:hypothetical protein [Actinomycetaceae bacterium]